ncbi:FecR domain-containing protein [Balneolaceae bacterium ANBcel3]|nr:FecR domain-containing protein [Balneolaceae bacterium ANBcel3]
MNKINKEILDSFSENEREEIELLWKLSTRKRKEDSDTGYSDEKELSSDRIEKEWKRLQHRIHHSSRVKKTVKKRSRGNVVYMWMGAAAAVFALVMAGWYLFVPVHLEAPRGSYVAHEFSDGVTVELNSGADIRWTRWKGHREMFLTGEAYFSVPGSADPFIVETHNARVLVHGTRFNVRSWPEDPGKETVLTLVEGAVSLSSLFNTETSVLLEPGQWSRVGQLTELPSEPEAVNVDQALAWRQQGFFFSSFTLAQIADELERRYDTTIRIENESLANRRLTLYMPSPDDLEGIIESIADITGSQYHWSDESFVLY